MLDKHFEKFPIIIISTPRSGSTALGEHISKTNYIRFFNEPSDTKSLLLDDNFVLKFHAHQIRLYPVKLIEKIIKKECVLIRIRRKNIINQIASFYVAQQTNIWRYTNTTEFREINEIDMDLISRCINAILYFNRCMSISFKYDIDLFYEDIEDFLILSESVKTPKFLLYEEIKEIIKGKLN